jgi:hypothetical protein
MLVLVSRVRKACRLSMHQIMLLHRYVGSYWEGTVSIYLFSLRAVPIFKASTVRTWPLVVC